jgi:hypothetical protein
MHKVNIDCEREPGNIGDKIGLRIVVALRARDGADDTTGKKAHFSDRSRLHLHPSIADFGSARSERPNGRAIDAGTILARTGETVPQGLQE